MSEIKFVLVGDKCIRCDGECFSYWSGKRPSFARNTSKLPELGVEVFNGYWRKGGEDGDATVQFCWYGETSSTSSSSQSKRADLKQNDGWTPRVCLVHERMVRDSNTHEDLT